MNSQDFFLCFQKKIRKKFSRRCFNSVKPQSSLLEKKEEISTSNTNRIDA